MATTKKTSVTEKKANEKYNHTPPIGTSYCSMIKIPPRVFSPEVGTRRASMIIAIDRKWMNGTKLKYYFFNGAGDGSPQSWKGDATQVTIVKQAFTTWKNLGIGLEFEETTDRNEAQVRIGFLKGDGAWSYIGRDVIDQASSPDERTMNFGWNLTNNVDTALHEIGHTLGFPHEHQNPNAGIVWDEEAVYNALALPPNSWDHDKTFYNIIRKLPIDEVEGSTHDANSVMHYPFGPGLIKSPVQYINGIFPAGGLSAKDKEFVKKFYPPITKNDYVVLKVSQSSPIDIKPGDQKNFRFIPTRSRKYKIETFGTMDMVMVLFEKSGTEEIYLAGDDDSGEEFNAKIELRLIKDREYIIRVRLFYAGDEGTGSIMVY